MSTYIASYEGMQDWLATLFGLDDFVLRLYVNDYTPDASMIPSSFLEASGGGYAAKTLSHGVAAIQGGPPPQAVYPNQVFTFTGALTTNPTVYGYYVTNIAGTKTYWAARLDTPQTPATNGDNITIPAAMQFGR